MISKKPKPTLEDWCMMPAAAILIAIRYLTPIFVLIIVTLMFFFATLGGIYIIIVKDDWFGLVPTILFGCGFLAILPMTPSFIKEEYQDFKRK